MRVGAAGLALLPETPEADPSLLFLFALFHDSMRVNDSIDPMHGPRAAVLATELRGGPFDLGDEEMELLAFACEEHTNGRLGDDGTVGVCWDADRLNLWRRGSSPTPGSSRPRRPGARERIAWPRTCSRNPSPGSGSFPGLRLG